MNIDHGKSSRNENMQVSLTCLHYQFNYFIQFRIQVEGSNKNFLFKANSTEDIYMWEKVIRAQIETAAEAKAPHKHPAALNEEFWKVKIYPMSPD